MLAAAGTVTKEKKKLAKKQENPFEDVHAFISHTLPDTLRKKLTKLLAEKDIDLAHFDNPALTHFITDSIPSAESLEYVETRPGFHYVTPFWAEQSVMLGARQEPTFYSPHPSMLFSGVVAASCGLTKSDNIVMAAGISSLGGQWRKTLTKDVTHLFALNTTSAKYETAMHFKEQLPMKILVPHWFDDTVRIGMRSISTEPYEWPEPRVFTTYATQTLRAVGTGSPGIDAENNHEAKRTRPASMQKMALYWTIPADTSDLPKQRLASSDIWKGCKVMFGSDLALTDSQREAHYEDVKRAGGVVVEWDTKTKELEKLEEADIYVCQYRTGRPFVRAYKLKKIIGNLYWFWYVRCTGTVSRPEDQLLHYPIPRRPIEGFSRHLITVTNYTGKDREYIKHMLLILGVPYSATMTSNNTAVIAAHRKGDKTSKADDWGVPVVNHTWVEDCFAQWRDISTALSKYTHFPRGVNYGDLLIDDGDRVGMGIGNGYDEGSDKGPHPRGRVGYNQAELDRMEREGDTGAERLAQNGLEDDNEPDTDLEGPSVLETPKKGILKHSKGTDEDSAATSRRLAVKRPRRDDIADASTYVDVHIALDDDGRLPMEGDDFGLDQDQLDVDLKEPARISTSRARPSTPAPSVPRAVTLSSKIPGTPARANAPATPKTKATPPVQTKVSTKRKTGTDPLPPSEDEEDEDASQPSSTVQSRRVSGKQKAAAHSELTDEDEPRKGWTLSRRAGMKPKTGRANAADDDDVFAATGGSAKKGNVVCTYSAMPRSRSRSRGRAAMREEEDASDGSVVLKRRRRGQPRSTSKRKTMDSENEEMEDGAMRTPMKNMTPASTSQQCTTPLSSDTEEEGPPEARTEPPTRHFMQASPIKDVTRRVAEPIASPKPSHTLRWRASIVPPTLDEVHSASQPAVGESEKAPANPISTKQKKLHSNAGEVMDASLASPPRRGRPTDIRAAKPAPAKLVSPERMHKPSPPPLSKAKAKVGQRLTGDVPGPNHVEDEAPAHSRCPVATEAAQKLHHKVMSDPVSFQKELKTGHVNAVHEEQAASKSKGKEKGEAKGKKRVVAAAEDEDEDKYQGSKKEEHERKKRKTEMATLKRKGRRSNTPAQPEEEGSEDANEARFVEPPKKRGRPARKGKAAIQAGDECVGGKGTVIMTTQATLSDDVTNTLTKMGVKFTTKPSECTHLVCHAIVRTEKFLCAMVLAPYVVTTEWAEMSARKKKIQPEASFMLNDLEYEKRYNYQLADALSRAKTHGKELFAGITFYVTPKVPVNSKLLETLVTAGGGQFKMLTQPPRLRILKDHDERYVISCPRDISIWQPLAENGCTIYTHELLLTGVMKQEIEWDETKYQITGSY